MLCGSGILSRTDPAMANGSSCKAPLKERLGLLFSWPFLFKRKEKDSFAAFEGKR